MRFASVAVTLSIALTACASAPLTFEPLDGNISGICHTDTVKGAVGLPAAKSTLERIRIDSDSNSLSTTSDAPSNTEGGSVVYVQVKGRSRVITAIECGGDNVAAN